MQKTEEFILNRLTWKARKYEFPTTYTFYFKDLSPDIQAYLYNQIDLTASDTPFLYFTKPTKEWTLICTRKIIYSDNEKTNSFNFSDIKSFKPTNFENIATEKSIDIKEVKKSEWDKVTIIDKQDMRHIIHADKGSDLFSLYNILLMAARLYK